MKNTILKFGTTLVAIAQLTFVSSAALAQEAGTSATPAQPATPASSSDEKKVVEEKKPVELSSELNLFMEVLFVQLKAKAYEKVYSSASPAFKKNMPLKDFMKFVVASRIGDFDSKVWVDKKWDPKSGLIVLKGEFTAADKSVHTISFDMVKKDDTYELLGTTETLTVQLLASLFPKELALEERLFTDLDKIAKAVKKGNFRKFYNSEMSKKARKLIKFSAFNRAMKAFRKEKKDISLSDDVKFVVAGGYPLIDPNNGDVTVKGEYMAGKYVILFTLGYNYEWEWKLNTLNINPVLPAEAEKIKEAEAKAAVEAKAKAEAEAAAKAKTESGNK